MHLPRPRIDDFYTRDQIHAMFGGGVQAFLPMKNARVVCGCFRLDQNPDAPKEVLVGIGERRETSAKTAVLQQTAIPVFIKGEEKDWQYVGYYRATRYLYKGHALLESEERARRDDVAGILYLAPCEPEPPIPFGGR